MRETLGSGVGVLAASFEDGKNTLLVVVTDDLRDRGIRADALIKDIASAAGGRGGGKPHMAQAGIPDAARFGDALAERAGSGARRARHRVVTLGLVGCDANAGAAGATRGAHRRGARRRVDRRRATSRRPLCLDAADDLLGELLARSSAGRESALDLLTVDALVTYAFEAAADSPESLPAACATDAMTRLAAVAHA